MQRQELEAWRRAREIFTMLYNTTRASASDYKTPAELFPLKDDEKIYEAPAQSSMERFKAACLRFGIPWNPINK